MILILGGNGFVGQHVATWLLDRGERVAVTTHSRSEPQLLAKAIAKGEASVVSLDITDSLAMVETVIRLRPKIVIDLTGHAPKSLSPARDVEFRTRALLNILESARIGEVQRVVLMSSMDVYWGLPTVQAPFTESDPVPLLETDDHFIVQSGIKKSLEAIGNLYRRQQGLDIAFIRASGIYGPLYRTYLNAPSRLVRAAVSNIAINSDGGAELFIEGGYDQLYVKDMARAIGLVALAPNLQHPVYNVGSGGIPTYGEFTSAVTEVRPGAAVSLAPRPAGAAPENMDGRWMSTDRIRQELGFTPQYDVRSAIADYIDWMERDAR